MERHDADNEKLLKYFDQYVEDRLRGRALDLEQYVDKCGLGLGPDDREKLRRDLLMASTIIEWQAKLLREDYEREQQAEWRKRAQAASQAPSLEPLATRSMFPDIPEDVRRLFPDLKEDDDDGDASRSES